MLSLSFLLSGWVVSWCQSFIQPKLTSAELLSWLFLWIVLVYFQWYILLPQLSSPPPRAEMTLGQKPGVIFVWPVVWVWTVAIPHNLPKWEPLPGCITQDVPDLAEPAASAILLLNPVLPSWQSSSLVTMLETDNCDLEVLMPCSGSNGVFQGLSPSSRGLYMGVVKIVNSRRKDWNSRSNKMRIIELPMAMPIAKNANPIAIINPTLISHCPHPVNPRDWSIL